MATCPASEECAFFASVEASVAKRIRFASAYPYCNAGRHEECALYPAVAAGRPIASNVLPDGSEGSYLDTKRASRITRVLVIEDSPVFATLAANMIRHNIAGADVLQTASYADAVASLTAHDVDLIVCGYGVGEGRTAHDLRTLSSAPMVILTGRPEHELRVPTGARVVQKDAGPEALKAAIGASLAS